MEWICVWLEDEEWVFPAMIKEMPDELLNPFKDEGIYYCSSCCKSVQIDNYSNI